MAVARVSLAAEQSDAVALRAGDEALERDRKGPLFGHRPVQGVAFRVVVLLSGRAASKLVPEEQIAHSLPTHRRLDLVAVEMWRETRVRERPHVYEELDVLTQDELRKVVELVVGVTDGPDRET
jgi:hypothetical protein